MKKRVCPTKKINSKKNRYKSKRIIQKQKNLLQNVCPNQNIKKKVQKIEKIGVTQKKRIKVKKSLNKKKKLKQNIRSSRQIFEKNTYLQNIEINNKNIFQKASRKKKTSEMIEQQFYQMEQQWQQKQKELMVQEELSENRNIVLPQEQKNIMDNPCQWLIWSNLNLKFQLQKKVTFYSSRTAYFYGQDQQKKKICIKMIRKEKGYCPQILTTIRHKYIAQIYQILQEGDYYFIVMERIYFKLSDLIRLHKNCVPSKIRKKIMMQLYQAITYLHVEHNLLHGDIDIKNILITSLDDKFSIKLIDFNWFNIKGNVQPLFYNSLASQHSSMLNYQTDIRSLAIVLYKLIFNAKPYKRFIGIVPIWMLVLEQFFQKDERTKKMTIQQRNVIKLLFLATQDENISYYKAFNLFKKKVKRGSHLPQKRRCPCGARITRRQFLRHIKNCSNRFIKLKNSFQLYFGSINDEFFKQPDNLSSITDDINQCLESQDEKIEEQNVDFSIFQRIIVQQSKEYFDFKQLKLFEPQQANNFYVGKRLGRSMFQQQIPEKIISKLPKLTKENQQKLKEAEKNSFFAPIQKKLTKKKGYGVFATKEIQKYTIICQYIGIIKTQENEENQYIWKISKVSDNLIIDASNFENIGKYLNSSNDKKSANCSCRSACTEKSIYTWIFSCKKILLGQQLTHWYGPDFWKGFKK